MGPLLLTGLAVLGALIAVGLVASASMPRAGREVTAGRRLAFVLLALATGCGVVGVVAGLLAITTGARLGPNSTRLLVTLTVAGALIAPFLVARNSHRVDGWVVVRALIFGVGLAVLGLVVALLSLVIHRFSSGSTPEWVFLVLGLLAGGGALGVGAVGARTMADVSRLSGDEARTAMSRAIRAVLPFELVGYGASLVGIVLVVAR